MKSKLWFLFVLGMLLLFAANVNAQVKSGSFSVSPLVGYSMYAHDAIIEDSSTYGISLGYNLSERFGLEATYNTFDTKIVPEGITHIEADPNAPPPPPGAPASGTTVVDVPGGIDVTGDQFRLEGLFYIYPGKKLAPYAALGIGQLKYDYYGSTHKDTNIPLGFGIKYFVTDKIAIRADFRDVYKLPRNNIIASIGVTFQFGGK